MRTDARRNRDAIIAAARDLVARDGDEVRMDAVAAQAAVAVGTIYRHFATKADLVDAVVAESVERIAALAETGLSRVVAGGSAWDELTWFFTALDDGHSAGRSVRMAAALIGVDPAYDAPGHPGGPAVTRSRSATAELLRRAQHTADMRRDVSLADLFMLMAQAPDRSRPEQRARYVEIVKAGLRPMPPASGAGLQ